MGVYLFGGPPKWSQKKAHTTPTEPHLGGFYLRLLAHFGACGTLRQEVEELALEVGRKKGLNQRLPRIRISDELGGEVGVGWPMGRVPFVSPCFKGDTYRAISREWLLFLRLFGFV